MAIDVSRDRVREVLGESRISEVPRMGEIAPESCSSTVMIVVATSYGW